MHLMHSLAVWVHIRLSVSAFPEFYCSADSDSLIVLQRIGGVFLSVNALLLVIQAVSVAVSEQCMR